MVASAFVPMMPSTCKPQCGFDDGSAMVDVHAEATAEQDRKVIRAIYEWTSAIEGRVALVTGGARGIGATICDALTQAGAAVVAADRSWAGADEVRTRLEAAGGLALEMDITDAASISHARETVSAHLGDVSILVNNAALVSETQFPPLGHKPTLETTEQDWRDMFEVNVFGTLKVIREFIEPMRAQGRGSIINVVSSGIVMLASGGGFYALRPGGREMPYQASKAALASLTFYLAEETWRDGIAVNAFMPGHTRASWFDETARAYNEVGASYAFRPVVPEHLLPLTLCLAAQTGGGISGRLYDVLEWNYDHGYGKFSDWQDHGLPADVDEAYARVERALPGVGHRSGQPGAPGPAEFAAASVLASMNHGSARGDGDA
jgi:NAD(P)-dependent dehydrogenase (short-subunit alcohol dehydrogenase family)